MTIYDILSDKSTILSLKAAQGYSGPLFRGLQQSHIIQLDRDVKKVGLP